MSRSGGGSSSLGGKRDELESVGESPRVCKTPPSRSKCLRCKTLRLLSATLVAPRFDLHPLRIHGHLNIREYILHLTPEGTNAYAGYVPHAAGTEESPLACPTWPPDMFAIVGSIIEHSGCYALATPDRAALDDYAKASRTVVIAGMKYGSRDWRTIPYPSNHNVPASRP